MNCHICGWRADAQSLIGLIAVCRLCADAESIQCVPLPDNDDGPPSCEEPTQPRALYPVESCLPSSGR